MIGLGDACGHPQEDALRSQIQDTVSTQGEAGQAILQNSRRAVVTENPPIGGEPRMQGQPQQSIFRAGEDIQCTGRFQAVTAGIPDSDPAPTFRQNHASIGRHIEGDGLAQSFGQHGALQSGGGLCGSRIGHGEPASSKQST